MGVKSRGWRLRRGGGQVGVEGGQQDPLLDGEDGIGAVGHGQAAGQRRQGLLGARQLGAIGRPAGRLGGEARPQRPPAPAQLGEAQAAP